MQKRRREVHKAGESGPCPTSGSNLPTRRASLGACQFGHDGHNPAFLWAFVVIKMRFQLSPHNNDAPVVLSRDVVDAYDPVDSSGPRVTGRNSQVIESDEGLPLFD